MKPLSQLELISINVVNNGRTSPYSSCRSRRRAGRNGDDLCVHVARSRLPLQTGDDFREVIFRLLYQKLCIHCLRLPPYQFSVPIISPTSASSLLFAISLVPSDHECLFQAQTVGLTVSFSRGWTVIFLRFSRPHLHRILVGDNDRTFIRSE